MQQSKPMIRTLAILVAALFAIATPIIQALTGALAVADTAFVREGEQTLRAAGYAFAIWTLIYTGLIAFAVYQALPSTRELPGLRMLGWPSVIAMAGCGLWLIAATYDAKWATVAIILVSAAALYLPLLRRYPVQHRIEFWLVTAPLSLLAGWLMVASAINFLTALTGWGLIDAASAPAWGAGGVLLITILAIGLTVTSKNWIYPLPVAWGLAGVTVAQLADRPLIAALAGAGAIVLVAAAAWVGTHRTLLLPLPRQQ